MSYQYHKILVAIDGSDEANLAFEKAVNVAKRNQAILLLTHVIDTRALQSIATFDPSVYETLEKEAEEVLNQLALKAKNHGIQDVKTVITFGNPKTQLAVDIPESENVDLIMLGATGLNTFERLLVGSSSEYIVRHANVDILIVRDKNKTL